MKAITQNGPVDDLITAAQAAGFLIIDETVLQQMKMAAEVAETVADEEVYESSLDDNDRAYLAYVDTFIRRQQRRNATRQFGR